jgi:hypothetical protein
MPDAPPVDLAGTELASETLQGGQHVLLAFLARGGDGSEALELGTWSVSEEGKLARLCPSLVFPVRDVDQVRNLVERAVARLRQAPRGENGAVVLARDGGLEAAVMRGPDGTTWASLGPTGRGGLAVVPAGEIESFVRVLAEAERELAELGLVALPGLAPG